MESFSRPLHRRKLSNANNGFSLSAKQHPYQDVFSGAPTAKFGAPGFPSGVEDYCEIFGGGSRGSSIPVLDLSGLDDVKVVSEDFRSSKLDYSNIFGGFRDDDVAVPYEEMFSAAKRGKTSSGKARASSEGSDQLSPSGMHKESSCEATNQSVDKPKHFNLSYHKTSQRSKDGSNGMTQIAQLHAVPGFTYFIDESSHLKKTEPCQQAPHVKNEVHRNRSFSGEIFKNGRDREGDLLVTKKQSSDGVAKDRSGSSWDGFHFNDKVYIAHVELDGRSQSTRGASTSSPTTSDMAGHPKQSNTKILSSKKGASERGVGVASTSPSSSDEELDANSVAAISAATLKKAIAKAQESIRLAKELMERKNDVIPASRMRKSKGSLKSKDTSIECNTRSSRGNGMERHRKIGIGLPPFAEVGMGIPLRNGDFESCVKFKDQQCISGMVKLDSQTENIEASERDVAGTRFPEVVSSRSENTKTLASQQVDGMNHSQLFLEKNKYNYNLDQMNTGNRTLEVGERVEDLKSKSDISPKINVDGKAKAPVLDKGNSDSAQVHDIEGCLNSKITKEYCFSKENVSSSPDLSNFENIKNDLDSTFDEQWSLKNLQNSKEPLSEENVVFLETENYDLHNDREKPSENGTLKHNVLESRIARKKFEDVHKVEENVNTLRRTSDEETELMSKEAYVWVENDEKLQHGCGREGIKSRQQDPQGGHDTGVHEPALSEKEIIHAHEAEESEEKRERSEMEGLQNISIEACQFEDTEAIENQADKYPQDIKIEARQEVQETVSLLEASDKNEDNQDTSVAPGVADKQNPASAGNEPDHNTSPCLSETQETCEYEPVSEALYELEECQKDGAIEESSCSREENILETACELRNATECDTAEGKVQDSYEASYDDAKEVNIGSTCMNVTDNLPSERVIFETESLSNVIQENIGCDESYYVPEVQPSPEEPDNSTSADINLEQTHVEGNIREPEVCSNPDAGDNLRIHEHVENEETIKGVGVAVEQVEKNKDIDIAHGEKKAVENTMEWSSLHSECKENEPEDNDEGIKTEFQEESSNLSQKIVVEDETKEHLQKVAEDKDNRRITDVDRKQREREKDRIAVERVIREARERAFAEARERAERAAVERATAEARQRVMAEAREKLEKASASNKVSAGKASIEAKRKAERAAVERATAEARERALEKALSQKTTAETRAQAERHSPEKFAGATRENGLKHSLSSPDLDKVDGSNSESAQRRKARLERHQRIMERAAKALAEKNMRDFLAQKEQTERNRLAEALDADVKRWASGKEGNLRALLSTLQYILGSDSGWQPISLTEIITSAAVKKAYRKATLYVHPDKLQQRGASIQQKYVCEKVFDLLKAAWNKFNSEER